MEGGALKPTSEPGLWCHATCLQWIPEVSVGDDRRMEPVMNIKSIQKERWELNCCVCKSALSACCTGWLCWPALLPPAKRSIISHRTCIFCHTAMQELTQCEFLIANCTFLSPPSKDADRLSFHELVLLLCLSCNNGFAGKGLAPRFNATTATRRTIRCVRVWRGCT